MTYIKNILIVSCAILLSFFSLTKVAEASVFEDYQLFAGEVSDGICGTEGFECQSIFGDPTDIDCPAYWMQWVLDVMKYIAIAALLILSTVDFIKALVANDKDALKKAGVTTAKRFIFCVLIFFLPILVDFVMELFGAYGTCGMG